MAGLRDENGVGAQGREDSSSVAQISDTLENLRGSAREYLEIGWSTHTGRTIAAISLSVMRHFDARIWLTESSTGSHTRKARFS